jgi:hypothetical protein
MMAVAVSIPGMPDRLCEDCADVSPEGDAVVLSDGVGSAQLGSLGSHTAVALVLGEIRAACRHGAAAKELGALLSENYRQVTHGHRGVAATCLFALVRDDQVLVGQAGDGLAGVLLGDGTWVPLGSGRGTWANETTALPSAAVDCRAWDRVSVRAVFLATDGVSDDLVPGCEAALVSSLFELARDEGADALRSRLVQWLTTWRTPGSMDDRSVGLLLPELP